MDFGNYIPKEITSDKDSQFGFEVASFDYYSGIEVAKLNNLKQRPFVGEGLFMVCCGDVMIEVSSSDFPNITRRII